MTAQEYLLEQKLQTIEHFTQKDLCEISFIGIDRSLTSTGLAVVCDGRLRYQTEIGSKEYGALRLIDLVKQITAKIAEWDTPFICMEDYSYDAPNRAHQLGELGGVTKTVFALKNIQFLEVAPTTLKKYVVGKGNAPKDMMPMKVAVKFKAEPVGGDAADAIGCAFFAYHAFRYRAGEGSYTIKEKEAFDTFLSVEYKPKKKRKRSTRQLALDVQE